METRSPVSASVTGTSPVSIKRPRQGGGYNLRKRPRRQSQEHPEAISRLESLSIELWEIILNAMAPSQLTIVAQVSKQFNKIVVQLPVWKHIATSARLGPTATRGRRKTYYGLVLSNSHRICEGCRQSCRRVVVYEAPLPVFLDEQNKKVYLCLLCRRDHYNSHPEPVGPDDNVALRDFYGGQVGIDAQKRRTRQLREKRDERLQPVRNERRVYLETLFAQHNLTMDEDDQDVVTFIRYASDNESYRRSWAHRVMENVQRRHAISRRRQELTERLQESGGSIQNNFSICQSYIEFDEGHIDDVVAMTVEVSWFVRETNYDVLRFYTSYDHYRRRGTSRYVNVDHGKARALRAYVCQRLYLRRWNDISMDQNLLARPPESLWWKIRTLTKSLWIEEAKQRFLVAGVHKSDELLQLDTVSPALLIQVLDRGAIASTAPLSPSESTIVPFSLALRTAVGEQVFADFVKSNLEYVMEMAQIMYVDGAQDNPPTALADFVGKMDKKGVLYSEKERAFIQHKIPEIAREEYIHPHYLIKLLEKLQEQAPPARDVAASESTLN